MIKHLAMSRKHPLIWVICLFCMMGCAVDQGKIFVKNGKEYGRIPGSWRNRWWNYYQRGNSYAEGEFWSEAIADFQAAIHQRPKDQWQARTYGMHFIDYFPHRELGIVLFHQKRFADAIRELEASLNTTVTAKAEFYLDQSRKALILSQTSDKRPPEILSRTPDQGLQTNKIAIRVSGSVRDDNFVKSVRINDKPIRIDLAAPEIEYDIEVSLRNGNNTITISAVDIVGNTSRLQRTVSVDRQGPVISIDEPSDGTSILNRDIRLKGYVGDDTNLASILINGREILDQPSPEFILDHLVALDPQTDRIKIEAADLLGNQTKAEIPLSSSRISWDSSILLAGLQMILHASSTKDPGKAQVRQDRIPPDIELKDWTEAQSVYLEETYLEGSASDDKRVDALIVNDNSILRRPGKKVYFNQIVELKEGKNPFHFKAQDNSGNLGTKSINIQRNIQEIRKIGSRMELMILPFERKGESGEVGILLEETLHKALTKSGRFKMKRKFGLSIGNLDDTDAAAQAGKNMNVNYVLVGSIAETKSSEDKDGPEDKESSMEIYAQIIDTKTSQILTVQNVYGVDIDREMLDILCRGLVIRLHDALPVSEGIVVGASGQIVFLDLGKESRIKEGMRCILFKEGEPLVHPVTGKSLGSPVIELGRAVILAVHEEYCEAEIPEVLADRIATSYKVITE